MRIKKQERIAGVLLGIYICFFSAHLKLFDFFSDQHDAFIAVETTAASSLNGNALNTQKNRTSKIEEKSHQSSEGDNKNDIRNNAVSIEEVKREDTKKDIKGVVIVDKDKNEDEQNIEGETTNAIDTSTIVIDGRPAGAIVSRKIIGTGENQRQVNYVFCEGCKINNLENVYCGDKYDYKKGKHHLSMEEAISEVMEASPDCGVPTVKLVPISNKDETPSSNLGEHKSKLGLEGKWIQDWDYSDRTTYINHEELANWGFSGDAMKPIHRWDSSWRWEDSNSAVTEISTNGFCQVCYKLGITRLFIVGDSITQLFYKALLSLLGFQPVGMSSFDFLTIHNYYIPCDQSDTPAEFRSVEMKYMRVLKLDEVLELGNPSSKVEGIKISEYANFIESNPNRTAIIFNTGAHMKDLNEYKEGFDFLLNWLDSLKVKDSSKIIGFYRDTVPGHPECEPHGIKGDSSKKENFNKTMLQLEPYADYDQYRETTDSMIQKAKENKSSVEWPWYWYQHANGTLESYNTYSKEVFAKRSNDSFRVHWLNTYNSTILRRDGHDAFGDCLHYHVPGPVDWWVHFFYSTLLDAAGLKQEPSIVHKMKL
jgi:hypothetical protein